MVQHDWHERRLRRSDDPITALHYQLAYARHHGGYEALVLVDESGTLVAGAGAWPLCEELAAYAPLLEHEDGRAPLRGPVQLQRLTIEGTDVLLAARGPANDSGGAAIDGAAVGCRRILMTRARVA